jgi:ABC-type Mn2+/Zn2+ transport system ATPase subunit
MKPRFSAGCRATVSSVIGPNGVGRTTLFKTITGARTGSLDGDRLNRQTVDISYVDRDAVSADEPW